ncbi:hypothetical protein EDC01DRAFT_636842 [Geopyxis carbonaria]|nr:hypothetical protein EDC01DRAFT_636842 [Geopyxis carbonaria]
MEESCDSDPAQRDTPPSSSSSSFSPTRNPSLSEVYATNFLSVFKPKIKRQLTPIEIPGLDGIMSNSGVAKVFDLDPRVSAGKRQSRPKALPFVSSMSKESSNPLKRFFGVRGEPEPPVVEMFTRSPTETCRSHEDNRLPKHSNVFTGLPTPTDSGGNSAFPSRRHSPTRNTASPKTRKSKQVTYYPNSDDEDYGELAKMPSVNEPMPDLYPGATMEQIEAYEKAQKAAKDIESPLPTPPLRNQHLKPPKESFLAYDGRRKSAEKPTPNENSPLPLSQQHAQAPRQHLPDQSPRPRFQLSDSPPKRPHTHRPLRRREGSVANKHTPTTSASPAPRPSPPPKPPKPHATPATTAKSRQRPTSTSTSPPSTTTAGTAPSRWSPRPAQTAKPHPHSRHRSLDSISEASVRQLPANPAPPVPKHTSFYPPSPPSSAASAIAPLHTLGALLEELEPRFRVSPPSSSADSDTEEIVIRKIPPPCAEAEAEVEADAEAAPPSPALVEGFVDMLKAAFTAGGSGGGGKMDVLIRVWCVLMGTWALFMVARLLEGLVGVVDVLVVQPGRVFWGLVGRMVQT